MTGNNTEANEGEAHLKVLPLCFAMLSVPPVAREILRLRAGPPRHISMCSPRCRCQWSPDAALPRG